MSKRKIITGIDPGQTGAFATFFGDDLLRVDDMPTVGGAVSPKLVIDLLAELDPAHVWIENVHSMPKQGVASTFKFGMGFGIVRCAAATYPHTLVEPSIWKKTFKLTGKPKEAGRLKAIEMFPDFSEQLKRKKDNGRSDAMLIALHGVISGETT